MENQQIQEKIIQYQLIQQRIEAFMKRRELFLAKMIEIETTINSISNIGKGEALLSVGSGVHVPGVLNEPKKLIVELGANVAVEEDVDNAKEILEKRKKVLENALRSLEEEMIRLNNELVKLEPEIRGMIEISQKTG